MALHSTLTALHDQAFVKKVEITCYDYYPISSRIQTKTHFETFLIEKNFIFFEWHKHYRSYMQDLDTFSVLELTQVAVLVMEEIANAAAYLLYFKNGYCQPKLYCDIL